MFALDNLICRGAGLFEDCIHHRLIVAFSVGADKVAQSYAGDVREAPERKLSVAVFADDIGVDAARVYTVVLAEQVAKARRIEDRAGADHPAYRQASDLRRDRGQDIDWVRG